MIRLLHVTDTHLVGGSPPPVLPPVRFADAVHALTARTTDELAASVLAHAQHGRFDVVLHTGDVADVPTAAVYRWSAQLLAGLGCPVLTTPGNHDEPGLLAAAFGVGPDPRCWSSDVGAWRIVLVSSSHEGHQGGAFGPAVLAGLERELATDRPVLVATHHPPRSWCAHPDCVVADAAEFGALVARHDNVVAVASGHLHLAADDVHEGVRYLSTPSTCLQLDHVHPLPEHNHAATPIGARAIELHDDGSLRSSVIWLPAPA